MQEKDFLMEDEKKIFERFSLGIDGAVVNKYHGILQELKMLFDPINPDKDTITTRQWNQRERIDNEFWLLQKLSHIMEKANFHELAKPTIHKALAEHSTREGVMVSVNPDKYDVLRFWALGKETPKQIFPWYKRIFYRLSGRPVPVPLEYYKRIVAAVRLRKDSKLILKMFKEVPINALEQLLPDGKIKMTKFDQGILTLTISIGMIGVMVKFVTMLAHFHVQWSLIMTGAAVLVAARSWTVYKNKRNLYLADLNRMLYYKNLANNRGLLTLLVDRAEDESFKEALLAYTFLLTRRPPSSLQQASDSESLPAEIGGIPTEQLEYLVENWISEKAGVRIEFDSEEAVNVLKGFGLLSEVDDKLFVLPLETASRHLPQQPESIILRDDEIDDIEGYDREKYRETETKLKDEEKKARRFGWF
ncbi:transmembrane protein 143-like isoform X2 [Tubulanus polymorphus]